MIGLLAFLLGAASARAASGAEDLPPILVREAGVKDPVFAILLGLLSGDHTGTLSRDRLERELGPDAARSRLPFRHLRELTRQPSPAAGPRLVTLRFDTALDEPIPYSILGYHPGSFNMTQDCVFHEWRLGSLQVSGAWLEEVHLLGLAQGRIRVDIDGWLDWLAGPALDDTEVSGLAVLKRGGRWLGLALGHSHNGSGRSGAIDFGSDRILFPSPEDLKAAARQLRATLEGLAASQRERTAIRPAGAPSRSSWQR